MAQPFEASAGAPGDTRDFALPPTKSNNAQASNGSLEETRQTSPVNANAQRIPTLRPLETGPAATMSSSSTVSGRLNDVRRPGPSPAPSRGGGLDPALAAKMAAFMNSRSGTPVSRPPITSASSTGHSLPDQGTASGRIPNAMAGGVPAGFRMPPNMRPPPHNASSTPIVPKMPLKGGLSARRGLKLPGGLPPAPSDASSGANSPAGSNPTNGNTGSAFDGYKKFVDTQKGTLNFAGKAVIHGSGIDFSNGQKFNISLDEVDTLDELGKGNYGTVYKVRHSRPRGIRRPGLGLAGNKASSSPITPHSSDNSPTLKGNETGVIMAMKELRLELDEAKFAAIIMELDILHRCVSPYIIDFYGAFFQEGAVYICIEFMDGGSIDKIYGDGIPESVLRKITFATTKGLKELKDVHNIIHRDVKPTNILVNTRGQVKICDFGVSGNLVASIAKTNIGCQSYMAPERISGGGMAQAGADSSGGTYSVQSDIWSLGLSIIECAMGRYPYPPETYNNIFSQLSAIVDGEPPDLPAEGYSLQARDFVRGCLNKIPKMRPTYTALLAHPWLANLSKPETISEESEDEELAEKAAQLDISSGAASGMGSGIGGDNVFDQEVSEWCIAAMEKKARGKMGFAAKPALHAAPLDTVSPSTSPAAT